MHDTPNGLSAKKNLEPAWRIHGDWRYRRLTGIWKVYLIPSLEHQFNRFPFEIHNFHSDNGSEYVNRTSMLNQFSVKVTLIPKVYPAMVATL